MDLTNYKPQIAIVYTSVTGNTEQLATMLHQVAAKRFSTVGIYQVEEFPEAELCRYDAVLVGTYTWGSGEIPKEMKHLYEAFEHAGSKKLVTAVFGSGDRFFADFCGAVDRFRDMLYVHTELAATLKVELSPQEKDHARCERLMEVVLKRLALQKTGARVE
ncbi:flavodoxin domain-containing protein [Planococcus salinus]|uniref:Flavodoxin n=1 Tax=Planococcus salinus TaxID=1848460 RepID=A0A3M8P9H1_9BACL|nr:flavodoxin domain-containing protein [Planococcus salinus]RNF39834.1 flavodoxin [Planococcus salinus]